MPGGFSRFLHSLLTYGFLFYTFIGTNPIDYRPLAERVDGNPASRVVVLVLLALAVVVAWTNRSALVPCLKANVGLFAVVGFCLASVLWSPFPDLALRRAVFQILVTGVAVGIAVGVTDLRRFHTAIFIGMMTVVACNFLAVAAWPSLTIADNGVVGLYAQKNPAGAVAMIAVVCATTWTIGASRLQSTMVGLGGMALSALFLVLTNSKTSIGLAALALLIIAVFVLAEKGGPRFVLVVVFGALLALAGLLTVFAAIDFDNARLLEILFGDASFTGRDELWAFALRSCLERPWLGHGYGAFWDVGLTNDPLRSLEPGTWLGDVDPGIINQAHNGYLDLWLQIGLPATVVATLVVLAAALSAGRRALLRDLDRGARAALGMLAALLFLHLLHNSTEATLFARGVAFANLAILCILVTAQAQFLADAAPRGERSGAEG
ncbi:exopolysaccharide production protein [Blastochloris viridis]|uniref:Exopolysaccharide production protein n=1 Tax=Blastochloris viridis TaxID=1079 RepID=A0A182D1H2_BLAVI|nr:exopolysaccharide production protein [Blastochloris viridis]